MTGSVPNDPEVISALQAEPVTFTFEDGVISTVCSAADQPAWVANFKKGVLSAFQNQIPSADEEYLEETSVSGKCKIGTEHFNKEGDNVSWLKDFYSCEGGAKAVKEIGLIRLPQAKSSLYDSL